MANKQIRWFILISIISCMGILGCTGDKAESFPELSGPYLGQKLPGDSAELFAPGVVSTSLISRDMAIMPDGKEIYFSTATPGYRYCSIMMTKEINGKWTEPEAVPFSNPEYMFIEPCITPDGRKMFYITNMPLEQDKEGHSDIWAVDRVGDSWGEPYNLGSPFNTPGAETFPSVTNDGTLYFTRVDPGAAVEYIFRSKLVDGKYQEPEKLPEEVNCGTNRFNAFVAHDESYIIVPTMGMEDSRGGIDYYIVFRDKDDNWSEPINIGDKINTPSSQEYTSYVTRDNKYFFFKSSKYNIDINSVKEPITIGKLTAFLDQPENGNTDIYWIKADFINDLRPEGF